MKDENLALQGTTITEGVLYSLYELSHGDAWNDLLKYLEAVDAQNAMSSLVNPEDTSANWSRTGEYRMTQKIRDIASLTEEKIKTITAGRKVR